MNPTTDLHTVQLTHDEQNEIFLALRHSIYNLERYALDDIDQEYWRNRLRIAKGVIEKVIKA